MARIRSIHPGLFTDEDFVLLSMPARLLYVGLLTECDDFGAFEWKPVALKMRLFPADSLDAAPLLAELERHKKVARYTHGGREYGAVRNFALFQRPKKPKSVHFIPPEFRTWVGLTASSSEPEGDEEPPVPKKSEKSPQMEDGGWRMEDVSTPQSPSEICPPTGGRGTRLPATWAPSDRDLAFATSLNLQADQTNREAERFRDYWIAQPGVKGRKADWSATWRNWLRRGVGPPGHRPGVDSF